MMDLGDVVPIFNLLFFYILPSLLIVLLLAIFYKVFARMRKLEEHNLEENFMVIITDLFYILAIIIPIILMILNFIQEKNSMYMLEHFWDYTYPSLIAIEAITMVRVWFNTMKRARRVIQ